MINQRISKLLSVEILTNQKRPAINLCSIKIRKRLFLKRPDKVYCFSIYTMKLLLNFVTVVSFKVLCKCFMKLLCFTNVYTLALRLLVVAII